MLARASLFPLLLAGAWYVTSLHPFSIAATVAVVASGVVAIAVGLGHAHVARTVAFVICEVVARRAVAGRAVPTFADVMSMLLRSHASKAVVLTGWLWLGWHLFVRATHG